MDIKEIKSAIEAKFKKNIPSHIFLDRMRLIDEDSRKGFAYNDPTYIAFYYWLGTLLETKALIEIGFRLGLLSGSFLRSCKTVKYFLALQEIKGNEFYSERLGRSNIKDVYKKDLYIHVGGLDNDVFESKLKSCEFDLAIINEESSYDRHRLYFDLLWPQLASGGIIVVDYLKRYKPSATAFKDFCISKNIEPTYVKTTYGVGLIRKD